MFIDFEDLVPEKVVEIGQTLNELTREGVHALKESLPADNIVGLFQKAIKIFKTEPTILDLNLQHEQNTVTVVGDTHGQFHDVLKMFEVAGTPSKSSTFIFNGDFVDRGAWGLETLILFLSWKLTLPQNVFLIRGNHESQLLTELYGYKTELETKYERAKSRRLYSFSKKIFAVLPLAVILQENTLVLHGGLFRAPPRRTGRKRKKGAVKIEEEPIQVGSIDFLRTCSKGGPEPTRMKVSSAISDVLWSDPVPEEGLMENSARGLGLTFGPDITQQFLKDNDLKLVIRSHEGPDARQFREGMDGMMTGYAVDHDTENGKLITVFSAPDYPQFQETEERINNSAAVVVLSGPDYSTPMPVYFDADLPRPHAEVYYDMELYVETDIDFNEVYPEDEEVKGLEQLTVSQEDKQSSDKPAPLCQPEDRQEEDEKAK